MNFQEIIDTEHKMLMEAKNKYEYHFDNCIDLISLCQDFIVEVKIESWVFNALLSHIRKQLLLSFFSVLRLHHVQAFADLRQVIEGTTMACYALANTDVNNFLVFDKDGVASEAEKVLKGEHYKWIEKNYPDASIALKRSKDKINSTCAHCNLVYAMQHFKFDDKGKSFKFSFFDKDDSDLIKGDLWFVGHVAGNLMDIFYGVNKDYNLLTFSSDFIEKIRNLRKINKKIRDEIKNKDRFKRWVVKLGQ